MKKYFLIIVSVIALYSCNSINDKDVKTGVEFQHKMDELDKNHADGTLDHNEMDATIKEKHKWEKEMEDKYTTPDERKKLKQAIKDKLKGK